MSENKVQKSNYRKVIRHMLKINNNTMCCLKRSLSSDWTCKITKVYILQGIVGVLYMAAFKALDKDIQSSSVFEFLFFFSTPEFFLPSNYNQSTYVPQRKWSWCIISEMLYDFRCLISGCPFETLRRGHAGPIRKA